MLTIIRTEQRTHRIVAVDNPTVRVALYFTGGDFAACAAAASWAMNHFT